MSNLKKVLVFLSLIFVLCKNGFSQSNLLATQNLSSVNIDEIDDNQIIEYLDKAKENGLSESLFLNLLKEKGLPSSEITKLVKRLGEINSSQKQSSNKPKITTETSLDNSVRKYETSKENFQKEDVDLTVFGSNLFLRSSTVFEPNIRIPTPSNYTLGPDDEIILNVFGFSEKTYNLLVNEEGNIYIPQVGPLYVNGLSIELATSKIKAKLSNTIYRAIKTGQTNIQLRLGKIKSIRVTVVGVSKKPGTYTVSSLTTVFNLLYLCGGPSDLGSFREIELIRNGKSHSKIDLYPFISKGLSVNNSILMDGDVLHIPYCQKRITLNGKIRQKGKYELIANESLSDLLLYSGGFNEDAYKSSVKVYQYTDEERRIINIPRASFNSYVPLAGDSILVEALSNKINNRVVINGSVLRPGEYELSKEIDLKELLLKAGGVKEDAYKERGNITRFDQHNNKSQLSFNLNSILSGSSTLVLQKNDSITIYSKTDLKSEPMVSIEGYVRNPGVFKWVQSMTLKDLILKAGGFSERANIKNIEIARRIQNINFNLDNYPQSNVITFDFTDSSLQNSDIILEPFDIVNVRLNSSFESQRIILIEGMVNNPGRYTLQSSRDRITDLLKRAGGFKPNADSTALVIKRISMNKQPVEEREKIFTKILNINIDSLSTADRIRDEIYKDYDKISINLSKVFSEKNSVDNMILEDGDILTIEQNSGLVKISGEVYYPTIVPFEEGASLKYYVQKSGSYTDQARRNGTLVIYPDGKAKKVKQFLFFRSYPKVVSRSEIFVPQKNENNKSKMGIAEWSVALSALAIVSNVIINLSR